MRLDAALIDRGIARSRAQAKALIQDGAILLNGTVCRKPAQLVAEADTLTSTAAPMPYVGRGGLKLERALTVFPVQAADRICLDIGASTGGFTDCLLQHGAAKVYALDVGHDQLAASLRADPRVISMEGTNIRDIAPDSFPEAMSLIVTDVSFISLTLVLPYAFPLLQSGGDMLALVKPQFEAGRPALNKHGVVSDPDAHLRVLETVTASAGTAGFRVCGLCPSGIRGGSGNAEYLLWLSRTAGESIEPAYADIVRAALAQEK